MNNKEIVIYATLYSDNLDFIEINLKQNLYESKFKRIEQGTVLIYNDSVNEFTVEKHDDSFYMNGRMKKELLFGTPLILRIAKSFKESGIKFSIDYQEETSKGEPTSFEFNISNLI